MRLIYLDNAATSHYKPFNVKYAFYKALKKSSNPGRSGHKLSLQNSLFVWKTREKIAKHFGDIKPENVIFTKNCTEALNIALQGIIKKKSGNVIASTFEHNSILRPLHELEKQGAITLTIITPENKKFITKKDVEKSLKKDTFLVCINSISNVTGNKNDIEEIGELCFKQKILFLVDNAQGVGHIKINMKTSHINFLAFSGHKGFLTPQGIGALCINSSLLPVPIMYGGTGTESESLFQPSLPPESLESGTLATPLIYSLFAGITYIEKHFDKHKKKVKEKTEYLISLLKQIKEITLYTHSTISGVVSFNVKDFDSVQVSDYLNNSYNIAVRGGLHCAPLTHKYFGTLNSGIVRVSLSFKTSKKDLDVLVKAIKELVKNKHRF